MLIFGLLQTPFIAGSWILEHPISFVGDFLSGFLSGLIPSSDISNALENSNAIYELTNLYISHDSIKKSLQEALNEMEENNKSGSALTLTNLALPFMLSEHTSITKKQALIVANWIFENCREYLDTEKYIEFMLNHDLFSAKLKELNIDREFLLEQLGSSVDISGNVVEGASEIGNQIAIKAVSKLGSRYWWGAPGGGYGDRQNLDDPMAYYFDCSGLVAWSHRQAGINIGRDTASGYSNSGQAVSYDFLQTGDVITFSYDGGKTVSHIGIYIGASQMVHAEGEGSGTRGQYANQCIKIISIAKDSFFYKYIKNCRRLY